MRREIVWSLLADEDLSMTLEYLFTNWNTAVVNKFLDKIEHSLALISKYPFLFPVINEQKEIRKCVVTKHNSLFYVVTDRKIEIVRLFDVRQNPKKLGF